MWSWRVPKARSSLAFARSLARSDVSFVLATELVRGGIVAASRSVNRLVLMPSVRHDPDGYAERLVGLIAETGARVVVPVNDATLRLVNDHRDAIEASGAVPAIGPEAGIRNILDKRAHLDTAKRLGIPCPVEFELTGQGEIPELIERLGFPMVLKRPSAGKGSYKWLVVNDERELRSTLEGSHAAGIYPICQELVNGSVVGLYWASRRKARFGRCIPLSQCVEARARTCIDGSSPTDPVIEDYARNFARELEWEGLGTFAFFVTPNGDSEYMEMNGRMWGTLEGSIHAGWDMPMWRWSATSPTACARASPRSGSEAGVVGTPAISFTWRSCSQDGDRLSTFATCHGPEPCSIISRLGARTFTPTCSASTILSRSLSNTGTRSGHSQASSQGASSRACAAEQLPRLIRGPPR